MSRTPGSSRSCSRESAPRPRTRSNAPCVWASALPGLPRGEVKLSVRRTLQALRIAVNAEFDALERLLDALPASLAPGGRVAILTFHSGEDRRVKKAFQTGHRAGLYASVAREVIRATKEETRANRRASSAKLRWAVRAGVRAAGASREAPAARLVSASRTPSSRRPS
jgi:16S rRNA (cytosine1402-N4)-methyltransferase